MEIVIKTPKKKKQYITRDGRHGGGGIIRIDEETCDILERILDELNTQISVKELASTMIKAAADNAVIKEEEAE